MKKTRNIIIVLSIVVICTLLVVFVGKSFAFFRYEKHGDTVNVITFNGLSVNVNSYNDAFNLTNARPEYDFDGMERDSLDFTITNHSGNTVDYQLKVENDTDKQNACVLNGSICPSLSTNYIKYSYRIDNSEWSEPLNLGANNNIIFTDAIVGFDDVDISIKIWVDSTSPNIAEGKYFYGKIILEAVKSDEDKIKVTFDPNGGTIGIASKAVVPGETYGNLPTPIREGYRFVGWQRNIYSRDRIAYTAAPDSNWTGPIIIRSEAGYRNIIPGSTYTITMDEINVLSGSASQITISLFDYTINKVITRVNVDIEDNFTYMVTCPPTEDSTHELAFIVYNGVAGETSGNTIEYINVNIYESVASSIQVTDTNHTLIAVWEAN